MSIIYTLIVKSGDQVLCEYTEYNGNFEQLSRSLLKTTITSKDKDTIAYDDAYSFHYSRIDNITYMTMSDSSLPSNLVFDYIDEIRGKFIGKYKSDEIDKAYPYSFNSTFQEILKKTIEKHNRQYDKNSKAIELNGTKSIHNDDTRNVNEENDKIPLYVRPSVLRRMETNSYFDHAQKVDKLLRLRKIKKVVLLIIIISFISLIVIYSLC